MEKESGATTMRGAAVTVQARIMGKIIADRRLRVMGEKY